MAILRGTVLWMMLYFGFAMLVDIRPPLSRMYVVFAFPCLLLNLLVWRYLLARLLRSGPFLPRLRKRMIMVGWTGETQSLYESVVRDPYHLFEMFGSVPSPRSGFRQAPPPEVLKLCEFDDIGELLATDEIDIVVLNDTT